MEIKHKIFIVEDETEIAEMYKIKLEKEWYEVKVATDWFKALTMIADFLPDLILLDIMMPEMNWFETLKTIRELAPSLKRTKIIMFSNLNSQTDIDKALESWADDYLLKASHTPKEIVEKIKEYLPNCEHEEISNESEWENILICPHCWKNVFEK